MEPLPHFSMLLTKPHLLCLPFLLSGSSEASHFCACLFGLSTVSTGYVLNNVLITSSHLMMTAGHPIYVRQDLLLWPLDRDGCVEDFTLCPLINAYIERSVKSLTYKEKQKIKANKYYRPAIQGFLEVGIFEIWHISSGKRWKHFRCIRK